MLPKFTAGVKCCDLPPLTLVSLDDEGAWMMVKRTSWRVWVPATQDRKSFRFGLGWVVALMGWRRHPFIYKIKFQ